MFDTETLPDPAALRAADDATMVAAIEKWHNKCSDDEHTNHENLPGETDPA